MNIAVLIKSVVATDESVTVSGGEIEDTEAKRVINPYDEYGLEEALRWKESFGGTVTVIGAGADRAAEALRTALAMGADEALLIRVDERSVDEHATAKLIASAISQRRFEVAWAGHMSVDNGAGQVAIRVAELLGWPHAGAVVACELTDDGKLLVTRDAEGDSEDWELTLPAMLTAQQGLNEPRYPALAGIMKAKRKPLTELTPELLGVDLAGEEASPRTERLGCETPPARPAGRKLAGTAKEQAAELLGLLRGEAQALKGRG
ncbi:electron transfer flavoprotein beta subunit/FixA family protein [Cohnella endophytica]|uniref:Electron transfer flavoprotein subunit beta n=1 Tax=Cohnella endophytica TaxID=2419778 RepID=A0A494XH90_9BACL|nr:electron transfer flavoprotein subunit beta/FixA family protein [Cohnella endophytica]RKP50117.1 electron transfer flavoprotein beta subunit/FixA family protein [Cohnella endophytica]